MPKALKQNKQKLNPEVELLKSQLTRALADYANLEKRTKRLSEELYSLSSQRIILKLLPILDMLSDAQEHLRDGGLSIVIKEFEDVLSSEGYKKIEPKEGERFNAELEEAVEVVETDDKDKDNNIVSTSLVGWMQKDNVVRPAKVIVSKSKNNS